MGSGGGGLHVCSEELGIEAYHEEAYPCCEEDSTEYDLGIFCAGKT